MDDSDGRQTSKNHSKTKSIGESMDSMHGILDNVLDDPIPDTKQDLTTLDKADQRVMTEESKTREHKMLDLNKENKESDKLIDMSSKMISSRGGLRRHRDIEDIFDHIEQSETNRSELSTPKNHRRSVYSRGSRKGFRPKQSNKSVFKMSGQNAGGVKSKAAIREPDIHNAFIKSLELSSENNAIKYGDYIVLNFENRETGLRKLTTNYRISEKAQVVNMERDKYDDNCVFRIIPDCQYEMQTNIKGIIDSGVIPDNVDVDYENFMSELESNLEIQARWMGREIRYGNKFQLVQKSSKRFL